MRQVKKACSAYNGKYEQLFELRERLPHHQLMVLDYDKLIVQKREVLRDLFDRLGLSYAAGIEEKIHSNSAAKATQIGPDVKAYIRDTCQATYERGRDLVEPWAGKAFAEQVKGAAT